MKVSGRFTIVCGRHSKFHFLSILGKMVVTPTADPDNPDEDFEGLETRAVEVLGQFSLESDDPANDTDRFTFMQQRREWPGKRYPPGADLEEDPYGRVSQLIAAQQPQPQGATGGPVPSTSGTGTSSGPAPAPPLPTPAKFNKGNKRKEVVGRNANFVLLVIRNNSK